VGRIKKEEMLLLLLVGQKKKKGPGGKKGWKGQWGLTAANNEWAFANKKGLRWT